MTLDFNDFPKIESPFVRKMIDNKYIVINEIEKSYEWVFEDENVKCVEKIHGTCCAIIIENGVVVAMFNRLNRIPFIGGTLSKALTEGVNNALQKGRFTLVDGILWGELIGKSVQKNEYKLDEHEWLPFEWMRQHLTYKSYHKYPKTFENLENWFKNDIKEGGIFSLYMRMKGIEMKPEGIVFTHTDMIMAKLRKDMFSFWYEQGGKEHKES